LDSSLLDESRPKRVKHTPPPKDIIPHETPQKPVVKKVKLNEKMKFCASVLKELTSKKNQIHAWPFMHPVDVVGLGLTDYFSVHLLLFFFPSYFQSIFNRLFLMNFFLKKKNKIIKQPMDLGTVRQKLESGAYSNPDQFASDIRLIFSNTIRYNSAEHTVSQMGLKLQNIFEAKFALIPDFPPSESEKEEEEEEQVESEEEESEKEEEDEEEDEDKTIKKLQENLKAVTEQIHAVLTGVKFSFFFLKILNLSSNLKKKKFFF